MIGTQALKTKTPVVSEYTTTERRPLKGKYCAIAFSLHIASIGQIIIASLVQCADIDVNRRHQPHIPFKDGRNIGKATISSGFQVFADGETNVKIPMKVPADGAKQVVGFKKPFQMINGISSKKSVTNHTGAINGEQLNVGFRANCGAFKDNSLFEHTISTTSAKGSNMNWLEKQLALMEIKEKSNKPQDRVLVTESYGAEGIINDVPAPHIKEIDFLAPTAKQYEDNVCGGREKELEPKLSTSDTGAIRKVIPDVFNSTKFNNTSQLPTFKLNVMAEEWNTTKKILYDHGTSKDSVASHVGVQQKPTFWNVQTNNPQPELPQQCTDATETNHNFPTTTQPIGRKIVGKKLTPFERGHQAMAVDILLELDDRTQEIERYERYKATRRKKAIEAMRVEQERIKRKKELYQNVPSNMKNPLQPTVFRCSNCTTERFGIDGFQRTKNTSYNPVPTIPLSAMVPDVKPSVWIIKYPTPPNEPIRYEPTDLLRMNYTPNNNADKNSKKRQEKLKK
ncbi:uncharacterized protein LOC128302649 [Anopheles moucheti]|uniref:uncharacterized protein LOC128302649 n=1 Tax=Anopheles moucheti TaxID=186751 RepID=UPI0022F05FD9|nr:uncharacterized protein LOC128302649 [Anopheles moucheti]